MVSQDVQNELHQQLLVEQRRLQDEIANLTTVGVKGSVFGTDDMMDIVDQHPADEGSELFEREKNLTLARTLQDTLDMVNNALARLHEGTYGVCANCGKEIPEKRLRAIPETPYCIECQAGMERRGS